MAEIAFHNTLYKWVTHVGLKHCARCQEMAGQIRTAAEWDITERPALHHGCGCALEPCNGLGELVAAPPYVAPGETTGAKWERPSQTKKDTQGSTGEGPGKGNKGGQTGEGPGKGTKPAAPPNKTGGTTERPSNPKAKDPTPVNPPGTPAATVPAAPPSRRR